MSPRAASRLESLGFEDVWDYTAGKAEWSAFGLPMAGRQVAVVADAMRPDVPSCGLLEPVSVALERMAEAKFPLYGANLRDAGGAPIAGFKDRALLEAGGVRIGRASCSAAYGAPRWVTILTPLPAASWNQVPAPTAPTSPWKSW